MDQSEYPSLPNLAKMHARLAADSRRVENVVDAQLDGIQRLLTASEAKDWQAVEHISKYLAVQPLDQQNAQVIGAARQLCDEFGNHKVAPQTAPKKLGKLLAACRAVSKFWSTS